VPFKLTAEDYKKNKQDTIKALNLLLKSTKDSKYAKPVHKRARRYASTIKVDDDVVEALIEFNNIIAERLGTETRMGTHNIVSVLTSIAYEEIIDNEDYTPEEKGEVIIRNILLIVGVENESIVKTLGSKWAKFII